ncbi:MAG TPA: BAX inhibitor protein [Gammaproteobacteria bacterium]|jgi:modulator of FtsH protease|nr:BAX inhibitor protein [Gammaproteobacteria bacterium]
MEIRSIQQTGVVESNKVLKNTYMLLSMTLLFSALMAGVSMVLAVPPMFSMVSSIAAIALIWFVLPRTEESSAGIGVVFAITGLLGFGLGPMLSMYLALPNGPQLIATAMGGTGVIFLGLSGYALVSRKDFTFLGGFLMVGLLVAFGAMILNIFLQIPAMHLALSAAIIVIMSGFILFDTSRIVNGGETNYVRATISLYLNIYNIFVSLLQILGIMGSDE